MMIDKCKVHLGWPRHGWPSAPMTRRINEVPPKKSAHLPIYIDWPG